MAYGEYYTDEVPSVNPLLGTLSHSYRRELIYYFESRPQTDADSLATIVSHIDERLSATSRSEVETALHHTHLPKLEERGWIDYDPRAQTIRYHGKSGVAARLSALAAVFSE